MKKNLCSNCLSDGHFGVKNQFAVTKVQAMTVLKKQQAAAGGIMLLKAEEQMFYVKVYLLTTTETAHGCKC